MTPLSTDKMTHDNILMMRHDFSMDRVDHFLAFMDEVRAETGESERGLSLRISDSPDTIRVARRNHSVPGPAKLALIADRLHTTVDQLLGRDPRTTPVPPARIEARPARVGDVRRTFAQAPGDLPVVGTALGHLLDFDDNGSAAIEATLLEPGETLHHVRRPPALFGNPDAYAIYVQGESMAPAHKDGALRVVNPRVGVRIGDDVIVQLRGDNGGEGVDDGEAVISVLIKTLVRRSASFITLQQLNPPLEFQVPVARVAAIHRVMDLADLLG